MPDCCKALRPFFKGTIINNDGFDGETGLERIKAKICDLVSFGRYAISNPDLPLRFKNKWPLAIPDEKTFYSGGAKGYIDYPTYEESKK